MKNSEILLFFFIIYSIITNLLLVYLCYKYRMAIKELNSYIDELYFELEKARRK